MITFKRPGTLLRDSTHEAYDKIVATLAEGVASTEIHEDVAELIQPVMENADFCRWPGAAKMHHARIGGLLEHTQEVVELAMTRCDALRDMGILVDREQMFVACVWHDLMKTRDYTCEFDGEKVTIGHHPYHKLIHHISGSYAHFFEHFNKVCREKDDKVMRFNHWKPLRKWQEQTGHCMLGHHGTKEWGAVREPQTLEARIVHEADYLSMDFDRRTRNHENQAALKGDKASHE